MNILDLKQRYKEDPSSLNRIKVIFLDFDGVMNSEVMFNKINDCVDYNIYNDRYGLMFDKNVVNTFTRIINETNAYIVISSSWRHGSKDNEMGLQYVKNLWNFRKMPGEIIDITPYYWTTKGPNKELDSLIKSPSTSIPRGYEIKQWLQGAGLSKPNKPDLIESYVIFDDDDDMLYEQRNNFIRTNFYYGITEDNAKAAIEILNNKLI